MISYYHHHLISRIATTLLLFLLHRQGAQVMKASFLLNKKFWHEDLYSLTIRKMNSTMMMMATSKNYYKKIKINGACTIATTIILLSNISPEFLFNDLLPFRK